MPKRYRIEERRDTGGYSGQYTAVSIIQLKNDETPPYGAVEVPSDTPLHDFAVPTEADFPPGQAVTLAPIAPASSELVTAEEAANSSGEG